MVNIIFNMFLEDRTIVRRSEVNGNEEIVTESLTSTAKKKKKWIYSDIMSFMSDMNLQNKVTDSNIISDTMMSDSNDTNDSTEMEIANKLVQAITDSTPTNIFKLPDIPPPPSIRTLESSDDAFGTFIQCSLTEIKDERDRAKVKRALMNTLFTELERIAERS